MTSMYTTTGLSIHSIAACKFLLEADLYFQGKSCKGDTNCAIENDCFCRSFLKPSNSTGKPVSLAKLISYVYPIDKQIRSADKGVPPFLSNLLTMKMPQREPGSSEMRHNNEQEVTFHELLVLYLPRINIEQLKAFISTCTSFCTSVNVANRDVVDMRGRCTKMRTTNMQNPQHCWALSWM